MGRGGSVPGVGVIVQQLVALAGIYLIVAEYLAFELYKGHVGIEFTDVENNKQLPILYEKETDS